MGWVGFELEIFVVYVLGEILKGLCVFVDEIILLIFVFGIGVVKKVWFWVYVCDDSIFGGSGLFMLVYCFEDS